MESSEQIRQCLLSFLREEIDLERLEDSIVLKSWNIHRSSDIAAQRLAYQIELLLAEHSSEHMSEAQLRSAFLPLVIPHFYLPAPSNVRTESAVSFSPALWQIRHADIKPVAASWSLIPA